MYDLVPSLFNTVPRFTRLATNIAFFPPHGMQVFGYGGMFGTPVFFHRIIRFSLHFLHHRQPIIIGWGFLTRFLLVILSSPLCDGRKCDKTWLWFFFLLYARLGYDSFSSFTRYTM